VNLLFRERAFWMYLTGQRLGDMRRLIRNYGRHAENVYPTGLYPRETVTLPTYGNEKVMTLHADEQNRNPLYQGCIHRDA